MKTVIGKYNEAKIFATTVEASCEQQILDLCNESWAQDCNIRIMPDCHSGKGCVIGTTMTIKDKIVPNLVGVDIGCGMLTTKFRALKLDLKQVDRTIKQEIPMGRNIHNEALVDFSPELNKLWAVKKEIGFDKVSRSLGSLGGGNHFIEIGKDEDDCYYLVIHSGSRNFGKKVAEYYQGKAVDYHKLLTGDARKAFIEQLKSEGRQDEIKDALIKYNEQYNTDLCYLEGALFNSYLNDMKIAQKFASLNRYTIANILCKAFQVGPIEQFETVHNYIDTDNMILRKGAISAQKDEKCLIPINMRDGSLLCVGKGNVDFNYSAPHGAGRLMSRTKARHELSLDEFKDTMSNVYSSTVGMSTLDEAPMAYKPIAEILENIKDTVDVITQIKPIYNVKAEE